MSRILAALFHSASASASALFALRVATAFRPAVSSSAIGLLLEVQLRGLELIFLKEFGAGDEDRTRNFQLGKLTLYH